MAVVEFCPLQGFKAAQDSCPIWPIGEEGWTLPALTSPTFPNPPPTTHPESLTKNTLNDCNHIFQNSAITDALPHSGPHSYMSNEQWWKK
ncbi:hypothetical protein NQZ68_016714 [Dissostichus eleginoides]|nr:hypothetical protein NQZ68_016714 [Dissostichus eleginoides]